jgi:phosphatidylserine/phosphatidylglycerophosphate/cardiolipin synthase-like enzyme
LCGSTNWTPTGLCAQSNNAIIIESPELAADYLAYWDHLKQDTVEANGKGSDLQAPALRTEDRKQNARHDLGGTNGTVQAWFSPNTKQKAVPRSTKGKKVTPPTPVDLQEVFDVIARAQQGALFLAFIPGSPSIVTKLREIYDQKRAKNTLFYLRGAATSPDPASDFRVDLYHRTATPDATVRAVANPADLRANASVVSVAGVYAAFAAWEAELYKIGHAVIHDKILVIDPFTDESVVITGSHNLGYKASYANDENLVIIKNNRRVAEAYAAHVLDVYEHYRWRWKLQTPLRNAFGQLKKKHPKTPTADLWKQAIDEVQPTLIRKAWHNLVPNDTWQDYYETHRAALAAEQNFWSAFSGPGYATTPDRTKKRKH